MYYLHNGNFRAHNFSIRPDWIDAKAEANICCAQFLFIVLSCMTKILTLHCSTKVNKGFLCVKNHSLNLPVGCAAGIEN